MVIRWICKKCNVGFEKLEKWKNHKCNTIYQIDDNLYKDFKTNQLFIMQNGVFIKDEPILEKTQKLLDELPKREKRYLVFSKTVQCGQTEHVKKQVESLIDKKLIHEEGQKITIQNPLYEDVMITLPVLNSPVTDQVRVTLRKPCPNCSSTRNNDPLAFAPLNRCVICKGTGYVK